MTPTHACACMCGDMDVLACACMCGDMHVLACACMCGDMHVEAEDNLCSIHSGTVHQFCKDRVSHGPETHRVGCSV